MSIMCVNFYPFWLLKQVSHGEKDTTEMVSTVIKLLFAGPSYRVPQDINVLNKGMQIKQ